MTLELDFILFVLKVIGGTLTVMLVLLYTVAGILSLYCIIRDKIIGDDD